MSIDNIFCIPRTKVNKPLKVYDFDASSQTAPFPIAKTPLGKKVAFIVASIATLGLVPVAHLGLRKLVALLVLPATCIPRSELTRLRQKFLLKHPNAVPFKLRTHDKAEIDGVVNFENMAAKASFENGVAHSQHWVIKFCPNGAGYEQIMKVESGKYPDTNTLFFNYRNVGESKGTVNSPENLYTDGETAVQYLLSKGVREENIVIEGHSLGGAIGTQVAAKHEKVNMISDRSFGKLTTTVKYMVRVPVISWIAVKAVQGTKWEMDSLSAWKRIRGNKLVVFHKRDGVIKYGASLYKALKNDLVNAAPGSIYRAPGKHSGKLKNRVRADLKPQNVRMLGPTYKSRPGHEHMYPLWYEMKFDQVYCFAMDCFFN